MRSTLYLPRLQRRRRCPLQPRIPRPADRGPRQVQPLLGEGMDLSDAGGWAYFFVGCWIAIVAIALYFVMRR